jgi:glycerophosphoryl diester phosphodiesterase
MESESSVRPDRSVVTAFFAGLGSLRRGWPQYMAADISTRVAATLILAPVVAWFARAAMARAGGGAVTDQDIVWFLLSPLGIATLLVVAAGSILAGLVGHTAIMTVASGIEDERSVSWLDGMKHAFRRLFSILSLAMRGTVRLIVDAAPWLLIAGIVYLVLFRAHDINYYLTEKPPEFWVAAILIGISLLGLAWFVGRRLLSWSIALPRLLFGNTSPAEALEASAAATEGRKLRALLLFLIWAAVTLAFSALITWISAAIGRLLIPEGSQDLARMAAGIGIASVIAFIGNLIVSIISSVSLALSLYELDRGWAEPWYLPKEVSSEPGTLEGRASLKVPGWAWVVAAIAVPAGALFLGIRLLEDVSVSDDVEITAHRGASARAPENTLASIRAAIADGAEWVEIDVQETLDGVVVVHHDADFMRVAKDPRKIWETPWADVSQISNGAWFGTEFEAERVASLEDVLRTTAGRINVNVELKTYGHGQRLEERTIEIVERMGLQDEVVLMSLDRPIVEKLKTLRPNWTVGQLAAVSIGDLTRLEADFLAVNAKNARPGFVKRVHDSGKELLVWTVNHPAQMSAMMSLGVDGIITDEPALARNILEQRAALTPVERLLISAGARFGVVEGADVSSDVDDA